LFIVTKPYHEDYDGMNVCLSAKELKAMPKLSRREFLKTISLTTGAVVINQLISGCTDKPQNNIDQGYQSEPEESKR